MLLKIKKEIKWWSFAAKTLPFAALALLISLDYFGYFDWYSLATISVIVVFISASVFWWWWALDRIYRIVKILKETEQNFLTVRGDVKQTKDTLEQERLEAQEWRNQQSKSEKVS